MLVQRFGSPVIATASRIYSSARRVLEDDRDQSVVAVVSARGDKQKQQLELAHGITQHPSKRETAMILTAGEREAAALLAMALYELGHKASSLVGPQVGIITNDEGEITRVDTTRISSLLDAGVIPVVAGSQGIAQNGDFTYFFDGGSELTAVALAVALKAESCDIYTDINGVYTADPEIVPEAHHLDSISFEEMLSIAEHTNTPVSAAAVRYARGNNLPLNIRSGFTRERVTSISLEHPKNRHPITGIAIKDTRYERREIKIVGPGLKSSSPDRKELLKKIVDVLDQEGIQILNFKENEDGISITLTLERGDGYRAINALHRALVESFAKKPALI